MSKKEKKLTKLEKRLQEATGFPLDINIGLTDEQVKIRNEEGLTNVPIKRVNKTFWKIIRDNLLNFFNILLIAIGVFMGIAQIEFPAFAFLFILGFNILIGLVQDIRARIMVSKLQIVSATTVRVLRNGEVIEIKTNELVVSDIVILKTGDQIIADGEVVEGNVEVNESLLTGESVDIKKTTGSQVLSGSYVTGGKAKVLVKSVGKANYAEQLQEKAKEFKRPKSEILRSINMVFNIIEGFVIVLGTILIVSYILQGQFVLNLDGTMAGSPFQKAVRSIAGSLVSMIPTGMYLLTSSTLALGVIRLAQKRMLVQELYCIEMLARVDTLCLDKTGTITDGTMVVSEVIPLKKETPEEIGDIILTLEKATGDTNNTANAFLNEFEKNSVLEYHSSLAFSSKRKYSAVMLKDGRSFALGAREFVGVNDKKVENICEKHEAQGERVLVLALSKKVISGEEELKDLEPIAVLVLEDNIKPDAITNIEWFKSNGVNIKIISGDNALSVSKIAAKVGVLDTDKFISLEGMSLDEVRKIANDYTVFGRVTPEQKEALISAMKDEGHVVAMTGDGVNDILALKSADCSIAMASGSQAARNAAHLVTLDSDFSALPSVVMEGRRVINNLQRTCSLFLCKTIFAIVMTTAFIIIGWIDKSKTYPYVTNNLYVWELLTIGFASLFLSFQPNNERLKNGSFKRNIFKNSLPGGLFQITVASTFLILHAVGVIDLPTALAMTVISFSLTSYVILLTICHPFDIYRAVLAGAILLLGIGLFMIDAFALAGKMGDVDNPNFGYFKIDYTTITANNWWVMLVVAAVLIALYIGVVNIVDVFFRKYDEKKEKELNEN